MVMNCMEAVVGIAGTAKNTGKTTTLLEAIKFFYDRGNQVFLTSIGYDGEDFDNVTGLPKPRVLVPKGAIVASALPLLESSPANFDNLTDTGVRCALGRVFLGCATVPGKVVLAGPTCAKDLASVIRFAPSNSVVLLDGAFSRLSPMVVADSLILATGAARSRDSHQIARELDVIYNVMSLPEVQSLNIDEKALGDSAVKISGGLFLAGQGQELGWRLNGNKDVYRVHIEGIINPTVLQEALDEIDLEKKRGANGTETIWFVFEHPIMLLLSGDILLWKQVLNTLYEAGCQVMVLNSTNLMGVTVNPYVPSQSGTGKYIATYVPPHNFLEDIKSLSQVPCTDIILEGPGKLHFWLERLMNNAQSRRDW